MPIQRVQRRAFIATLGGAVAWPLTGVSQQLSRVPRVGILWIAPQSVVAPFNDAFREGLREFGYVEGQTVVIEARFADGKIELLSGLAQELVRLRVDAVVAPATPSVVALKRATTTIPIVMANVSDPVGFGFVASLREPGGNITGFSNLMVEQVGKNAELCREVLPNLSRLTLLANPAAPDAAVAVKEAGNAARALGFTLHSVEARQPNDLESAIAKASQERSDAILVSTIEGFFFANRKQIIDAAAKHRLPTFFAAPPFGLAKAGALLAYGANTPDMLRRTAAYVDKIIKGSKPADLPVQQPVKFELGVNLNTARSLGLTIPQSVLLRADEVIE